MILRKIKESKNTSGVFVWIALERSLSNESKMANWGKSEVEGAISFLTALFFDLINPLLDFLHALSDPVVTDTNSDGYLKN